MRKSPTIQSVEKALRILMAFTADQPRLGISQISRMLAMPKPGVYRLMISLEKHGFVRKAAESDQYEIGPTAFEVGGLFLQANPLVHRAQQVLRTLADATLCTAQLGVRVREEPYLLISVAAEARNPVRIVSHVGSRIPLHATAAGKAVLAFLPEPERDEMLGRLVLKPFTASTVTDLPTLRDQLIAIRARGWAQTNGEWTAGLSALAAPVMDLSGTPLGSVVVAWPSGHLDEAALREVAQRVVASARELSLVKESLQSQAAARSLP